MRIVLTRTNPVSPEPPVEKVALELANAGHEVTVLAWDRESLGYSFEKRKVLHNSYKIIRIGERAEYGVGFRSLFPFAVFQLKMFFWFLGNRNKVDAVHAFDFDTGFLCKIFCCLYRKKFVYHILDYYADTHFPRFPLIKKVVAICENWVINGANCTIICSEKRREQLSHASPRQLLVIHNTPSIKQSNGNFKISQTNRVRIVYVGVLTPDRMIEELMDFVSKHQIFELHIAGYGILESKVKEVAAKFDNILYYGKICYEDAISLERQCDIMTALYNPNIINHQYAAPNKFYESLFLGKPIVVIRNTAIDQYVLEYNLGVVIDYSKESLRKGLLDLYERRQEWSDISKRAKKLYSLKFSWEIMALRLRNLYTSF